ncbi:MAG: hypothetical protein IJ575_00620 [Selenomonadaceae bacterium]|nr:hypothetical protein [Selenomonadaceae bacterium]
MSYINDCADEFIGKMQKLQTDLANFSRDLNNRSDSIPQLIDEFENRVFASQGENFGSNEVEKLVQQSLESFRQTIQDWRKKVEQDRKGQEFYKKHEKCLVVMVFGAVKAGKSSLGNFIAGKSLLSASFDNDYKKIPRAQFESEEEGRETGGITEDGWFQQGVTDTTGSIQFFTLSGLRWFDSPGTGAVGKSGDKINMDDLVNEYLQYTDLGVFLMNSANPGLQEDMKYMIQLDKEGRESLIIITQSDKMGIKRDSNGKVVRDANGKVVRELIAKDSREIQEEDVKKRAREGDENMPPINAKFGVLSVSTLLAEQAVAEQDDDKFRASNLDKFMKQLGDKVNSQALELKRKSPETRLNAFVDTITDNLKNFNVMLDAIEESINDYKSKIETRARSITSSVMRKTRADVQSLVRNWDRQVRAGGSFDRDSVNSEVSRIMQQHLNSEIDKQLRTIISDYQSREIQVAQARFNVGDLSKQTKQVAQEYTEFVKEKRIARGFFESVREIFGAKFYDTKAVTKTKMITVEAGTNLQFFLDQLMPQVESHASEQAESALKHLESTYFAGRERFVINTRREIATLDQKFQKLKF